MPVFLTNTLSGKKEEFHPLVSGEVRMYTCGPTVYDYAHIGNFRAYVFEDILRRVLESRGYRITQVMNITDVDDKTIRGARQEGITLDQFTKRYTQAFFQDLDALRIERAEHYPRATAHIPEMVRLIDRLLKSGHAYEREGSVYYRISSFTGYGKLSKKDLSGNIAGARVDQDEYQKDEPSDFALWKKTGADEPRWDAPFGTGRPGWHIECSAMSMKLLGESFDIHTGGEDNIFPHHENEIAQSEAASGKPLARYWVHCRFLLVDGEKMSKSKGNFYTVRDLLGKGHDPLAIRYLLLSHHYGQLLNFTQVSLEAASKTVQRVNDFSRRFHLAQPAEGKTPSGKERDGFSEETARKRELFNAALDNDLNTAEALGYFFDWMNEAHRVMDRNTLSEAARQEGEMFLLDMDRMIDVCQRGEAIVPDEVKRLSAEREEARAARDFKRADLLRTRIREAGFDVEDELSGCRLKKI